MPVSHELERNEVKAYEKVMELDNNFRIAASLFGHFFREHYGYSCYCQDAPLNLEVKLWEELRVIEGIVHTFRSAISNQHSTDQHEHYMNVLQHIFCELHWLGSMWPEMRITVR